MGFWDFVNAHPYISLFGLLWIGWSVEGWFQVHVTINSHNTTPDEETS